MISPSLANEQENTKALEIRATALQMPVDNLRKAIASEEEWMGSFYKTLVEKKWLKEPTRLQVYREILKRKIQASMEPFNPESVDYC